MFPKIIMTSLLLLLQCPVYAAVKLTEQVRTNFGITTVVAVSVQSARQWQAAAQVLDASMLVNVLADLNAAQASASASSSELKRLESLYQSGNNAALKTVESARAQSIADSARVQSLQAQLLSTWGNGIGQMAVQAQDQLLRSLLSGKTVLARAELLNPAPAGLSASTMRLRLLSDNSLINAKLLGPLPHTHSQSLGNAYLLSVANSSQFQLQPGQILSAELQDVTHAVSGIKVPKSCVVRWQGRHWVYVEHEQGHYQRVAVSIGQWLDEAVLITNGIKVGDKVVAVGAGLILGAELSPQDTEEEKEE